MLILINQGKKLLRFIPHLIAILLLNLYVNQAHSFAKGADVSWLTEMENSNYRFYDNDGVEKDVFQILKRHGMDSIRLRVWVNPSSGWNNVNDTVKKAVRAKNAGMRILIDFHYSDSWADPGKQTKPSAWSGYSFTNLTAAVGQHTRDTLYALKNAGITPEWVQVGNETNNGMLWEDGRASQNMKNFATLVNSGSDAVKTVFPNAKVIVHISNCHDNSLFRWIFDGLKNNGARWDIIGASDYPTTAPNMDWKTANSQCLSNLNDMASRYNKDVMIVEVGTPWDNSESKSMVADIISKVRQVNSGRGLGVFYWEPEAYSWQGYSMGAWNYSTRQPTAALDAFLEGASISSASSSSVSTSKSSSSTTSKSSSSTTSKSSSSSSKSSSSASSQTNTDGQQCNWYGTLTPLCTNTTSGWGYENNKSCVAISTCSAQPSPYGVTGSGGNSSTAISSSAATSSASVASSASQSSKSSSSSSNSSSVSSTNSAVCNWYGTNYPMCTSTQSGWGWENNMSCISPSTCGSQ